jgi:hypothetical protein
MPTGHGSTSSMPSPDVSLSASLLSLGGVPDNPKFDNALVFNTALERGIRSLYVPRGSWHFLTRPMPVTYAMEIFGDGFGCSALVRQYAPQSDGEGLLTLVAGASHIGRIGICAGANTAGGAGIALISDGTNSPDYSVLEDVYVTVEPGSIGTWSNALLIDGSARVNAPIGVRDINVRNTYLFASTNAACRISGGVGITLQGGGLYPAAGTNGRLQVTGTGAVPSYYVALDTSYLGGLSLDNCNYVNIRAAIIAGDVANASSADNVVILGACTGTAPSSYGSTVVIAPARRQTTLLPAKPTTTSGLNSATAQATQTQVVPPRRSPQLGRWLQP